LKRLAKSNVNDVVTKENLSNGEIYLTQRSFVPIAKVKYGKNQLKYIGKLKNLF